MEFSELNAYNITRNKIILNSISELVSFYHQGGKPEAKIVIENGSGYITFELFQNIQFIVRDIVPSSFDFIENKKIVHLNQHRQNLFQFFILEFWQGKGNISKTINLLLYCLIIVIFNFLIIYFGTEKNQQFTFTGLLSAASIFIAVFSIFLSNSDLLKETKKSLFSSGKLGYYFSVDKNITISGIICIISSFFGLMIVGDSNIFFRKLLYVHSFFDVFSKAYLILFLLNISFIFLFIILRSLVEFYVIRPGKFSMGAEKDEFLGTF